MSSSEQELKAGHPPAVKAGGMRITQHKGHKGSGEKLADDADLNNAALRVSTSPAKIVAISGAPVRGNVDFPTEAVQSYHEKPLPTHDHSRAAPHPGNRQQSMIHQPRKQ